jgi:hypothetical protein
MKYNKCSNVTKDIIEGSRPTFYKNLGMELIGVRKLRTLPKEKLLQLKNWRLVGTKKGE